MTQLSLPPQPATCVLNRRHSLCDGLIFAEPWWYRGFRDTTLEASKDFRRDVFGDWSFSVDQDDFGVSNGGHKIKNGFGASNDRVIFTPANTTDYDVPGNHSVTIMCVPRPKDLGQAKADPPFCKIGHRNSGGTDGAGYGIFPDGNSPGKWEFEIRRSAAGSGSSRTATSTTDISTEETHVIVGRMDKLNNESSIWINGAKEGTDTAPDDAGNSVNLINALSDDQGRKWLGDLNATYIWGRALADSEIGLLAADPFILFRPVIEPLAGGSVGGNFSFLCAG